MLSDLQVDVLGDLLAMQRDLRDANAKESLHRLRVNVADLANSKRVPFQTILDQLKIAGPF